MENIRFGKVGASDEEVYAAAQEANAHEFISRFPDGYSTMVGGSLGGKLLGQQDSGEAQELGSTGMEQLSVTQEGQLGDSQARKDQTMAEGTKMALKRQKSSSPYGSGITD